MNAMRNLSISTSFPPIGTFTLDSTLGPPPNQHSQGHQISQQPPTIGIFDANEVSEVIQNPATIGVFQSNSVLTNGSGNSSSIFGNQSGTSGTSGSNDPSQTTRETGIIEKLLVSEQGLMYLWFKINTFTFLLAFLWIHSMLRTPSTLVLSFLAV